MTYKQEGMINKTGGTKNNINSKYIEPQTVDSLKKLKIKNGGGTWHSGLFTPEAHVLRMYS